MNQKKANINTSIVQAKVADELYPIAKQAESIEITDSISLKQSVELLSKLNSYNDRITEEKERVTKPLNEALKAERSRWKPLETLYLNAIDSIRSKMTLYQTNLVNSKKETQQQIASRIGEGKGHLKVETAIKKLEELPDIAKEVATDDGLVQFRETKVLKILDLSLIPEIYWQINEKELLTDLKAGNKIPGATLEIIQTPINYRA